jgi:hypothetical protein
MANGTNATRGDEKTITLSGTAANLVVAAGDVLEWQSVAHRHGHRRPGRARQGQHRPDLLLSR